MIWKTFNTDYINDSKKLFLVAIMVMFSKIIS